MRRGKNRQNPVKFREEESFSRANSKARYWQSRIYGSK